MVRTSKSLAGTFDPMARGPIKAPQSTPLSGEKAAAGLGAGAGKKLRQALARRPQAPQIARYGPGAPAPDPRGCYLAFYAAVHEGAAAHYSPQERAAWAPEIEMPELWEERLEALTAFIATAQGAPIGFLILGPDGFIDLFYISPAFMGSGLADRLYESARLEAKSLGLSQMSTEASHLARSFFARHGWQVEARQSVIRAATPITNFRMFTDI
ncbi:MAG: GNAT family N-acetyltransferase [Paracoccaceae bacterium]